MVILRAGAASAVVDPVGGRVSSLTVAGLELLVTSGDHRMDCGLYPMVPFAGRVGRGRFRFNGEDVVLPANLGEHAIHGTVLDVPWSTEQVTAASWRGRAQLVAPWPFGGDVVHEVDLRPDALVATLVVTNDERAMPVTCGWHPWWRRRLTTGGAVVVDAVIAGARMYRRDDHHLPTGELVAPTPPPWDDCFTGLASPPVLHWPGGLTLTTTSTVDHWVLYTEPPHAVCVEPQTGPPDAFNLGRGFAVVEPGRPLTVETTWRWTDG